MKIGVIGSGTVGQTLAAGFLKHGHQVTLGTRNPKDGRVLEWQAKTPGALLGAFADTAAFGELLVLAVLGGAVEEVIRHARPENFRGKTVIDTNNPHRKNAADRRRPAIHHRPERVSGREDCSAAAGRERRQGVQQRRQRTHGESAL